MKMSIRGKGPRFGTEKGRDARRERGGGQLISEKNQSPHNSGIDAMSWALSQTSKSPFFEEIESSDPPQRFVCPTFVVYNGKSDPVEHVSHFNQRMVLHA